MSDVRQLIEVREINEITNLIIEERRGRGENVSHSRSKALAEKIQSRLKFIALHDGLAYEAHELYIAACKSDGVEPLVTVEQIMKLDRVEMAKFTSTSRRARELLTGPQFR